MEGLIDQFHSIVKDFRLKRHDLLAYHNNKFDRDYVEFNVKISDLECSLQVSLLSDRLILLPSSKAVATPAMKPITLGVLLVFPRNVESFLILEAFLVTLAEFGANISGLGSSSVTDRLVLSILTTV